MVAAEVLALTSLLMTEELLTHHLLIMVAIVETDPTAHFITSVLHQVLYIEQLYQLYTNQIKNTSEYLKLLSKTAIITTREILDTKNMLIARNCLNISGN